MHYRLYRGAHLLLCLHAWKDALVLHVHKKDLGAFSLTLWRIDRDKIEILTWQREGETIRGLLVIGRKEHRGWGMFLGRWRTYQG